MQKGITLAVLPVWSLLVWHWWDCLNRFCQIWVLTCWRKSTTRMFSKFSLGLMLWANASKLSLIILAEWRRVSENEIKVTFISFPILTLNFSILTDGVAMFFIYSCPNSNAPPGNWTHDSRNAPSLGDLLKDALPIELHGYAAF